MADSSVSVSGPVSIESDSKARVAFDLMTRISQNEKEQPRTREYFLTLFSQCYQVANGTDIEYVTPKF